MLILRYHSFRKCLFSSHAYFQERAYHRENTVNNFDNTVNFRATLSAERTKALEAKARETKNKYGFSPASLNVKSLKGTVIGITQLPSTEGFGALYLVICPSLALKTVY